MGWIKRGWRRLRVRLTGAAFNHAVERYERAASELDKAVREVLAR